MIRILQLRDHSGDFETERSAGALLRSIGDEFQIIPRTLGRGGDFRDISHAVFSLRRENPGCDLIHAFALVPTAG